MTNAINKLAVGTYQPLAPWSTKLVRGGWTQDDRQANKNAHSQVQTCLVAAGFREWRGTWYSPDGYAARICADHANATTGVEVYRSEYAERAIQLINGED